MVLKHFAFVYEYIWTLPSHNQQNEYTEAFNLECATEFFFISQPKHILWVLKRIVSMRQFFWAPKTYANNYG